MENQTETKNSPVPATHKPNLTAVTDPYAPPIIKPSEIAAKVEVSPAVQSTGVLPVAALAVKKESRPDELLKNTQSRTVMPQQLYKSTFRKLTGNRKNMLVAAILIWLLVFGAGIYAFITWRAHNSLKNEDGLPTEGFFSDEDYYPYNYPGSSAPAQSNPEAPSGSSASNSTGSTTATPTRPGGSIFTGSSGGGSTPAPAPTSQSKVYTVSYTSSCFSPSSVTINAGETVKFVNNYDKNMWPASDDHPSHNEYPEFDAGRNIAPGSSYQLTFTKKGTWGYHDHNKPGCKGTVIVK